MGAPLQKMNGIGGGGLGEGVRAFALSPSPKTYAGIRLIRAPRAESFSTRWA